MSTAPHFLRVPTGGVTMATLYQLLLEMSSPEQRALSFLSNIGKHARLKKLLLLVGATTLSAFVTYALVSLVDSIRNRGVRAEMEEIGNRADDREKLAARIGKFSTRNAESRFWVGVIAVIVIVVL